MKQLTYIFVTSFKNGRCDKTLIFANSFEDAVNYCKKKYSERTLKRSALFMGCNLVYDFDK